MLEIAIPRQLLGLRMVISMLESSQTQMGHFQYEVQGSVYSVGLLLATPHQCFLVTMSSLPIFAFCVFALVQVLLIIPFNSQNGNFGNIGAEAVASAAPANIATSSGLDVSSRDVGSKYTITQIATLQDSISSLRQHMRDHPDSADVQGFLQTLEKELAVAIADGSKKSSR